MKVLYQRLEALSSFIGYWNAPTYALNPSLKPHFRIYMKDKEKAKKSTKSLLQRDARVRVLGVQAYVVYFRRKDCEIMKLHLLI